VLEREELDRLAQEKQALLVESSLNRIALQTELQSLRSASGLMKVVGVGRGGLTPLLVVAAPVAGFLLGRRASSSASWLRRMATLLKWMGPVYGLWKGLSGRLRKVATAQTEARAK